MDEVVDEVVDGADVPHMGTSKGTGEMREGNRSAAGGQDQRARPDTTTVPAVMPGTSQEGPTATKLYPPGVCVKRILARSHIDEFMAGRGERGLA